MHYEIKRYQQNQPLLLANTLKVVKNQSTQLTNGWKPCCACSVLVFKAESWGEKQPQEYNVKTDVVCKLIVGMLI